MQDNLTACPLDCYDACGIEYDKGRLKGVRSGLTHGFLCQHLNHYSKFSRILSPRYRGESISMDEALFKLKGMLLDTPKKEILHYRSSGNFGLMQEVSDHFFASLGATLTNGSLCDGAGEAGIVKGRGSNKNMPIDEMSKSDVVIVWGRNPHVTSSHLLPIIKNKKLIVIDPIKTTIATQADIFIQIKPHCDSYLAMILTKFSFLNKLFDEEYLNKYASKYKEYYQQLENIDLLSTLDYIGVTLEQIENIYTLIQSKKVAIVTGVGIQKYKDGADTTHSIDALATVLGLFGREGCGVSYLGNSKEAINSPFMTQSRRVSKVNTPFNEFKTVFIQAANPLCQMPDTHRVKSTLSSTQNIIYFGLYENETSDVADLVIPAKNFLEKSDIRTSYSHNNMMMMQKQYESEIGISEYDLVSYLCHAFKIDFKDEAEYIKHFMNFSKINGDTLKVSNREEIPYTNGFDTDDREFNFPEKLEIAKESKDGFYLISCKSPKSLNSQFKREEFVYLHSSHDFLENEQVKLSSKQGSVTLKVKHNDNLRRDSILVYSGTMGVNNLTCSEHSSEGKNAIYQENRVQISKC
ncbi:molybdopterin-dependent oxidoreductase [Sulfurimonas aquatica]|uniref:Molybdopterin-dependent oxidoreductase n=1 Tax=Sulfurimonas aquatica TaxID=2672570 RepID=A0A975AZR6_9BACT|nr:molybdopterin-dependent oxidoreductase [Sulfurimonas aquatica]QSZ41581.1 molybdopterin-dependent oxidoreductase [Sulfurimonas aquatica]